MPLYWIDKKCEKLSKKYVVLMIFIGFVFYFLFGQWVSIEEDSPAYIDEKGNTGVMPLYPLFINIFQNILDEDSFLSGVVIGQSLLAVICTLAFVLVLQKQYKLCGLECIILYILSMLPFSIYLPQIGITHQIMTEGISYSLFYLFYASILKGACSYRYRWYIVSLGMAFVLGLVRTQMLFLQIICFLLLIWIVWKRRDMHWAQRIMRCLGAVIIGAIIALASYKTMYGISDLFNAGVSEKIRAEQSVEETTDIDDISATANNRPVLVEVQTTQFDHVLICRGFYEADREDVNLFSDDMMKTIFLSAYDMANEKQKLYKYARDDLYIWKDLVYDKMIGLLSDAIDEYDSDYPGMRDRTRASIVREMGWRLMLRHFDRYIYHTCRLMISSFIASVFFQIESIYLLCHFITIFLYSFAVLGAIWLVKRRHRYDVGIFIFMTLSILLVMVGVTNLVFMGMQRYVVYCMGIFYCAMFLLCKEIVLCFMERRGRIKKEMDR